jgi:hypothetical protein
MIGMRQAFAIFALALAGCGSGGEPGAMTNGAAAPVAGAPDNRIDCALDGAARFEHVCTLDGNGDGLLTIRKADGGFRRLRVTHDGHGVVAADGAEPAVVTLMPGGRIEVAVGADRFRLPATVRR